MLTQSWDSTNTLLLKQRVWVWREGWRSAFPAASHCEAPGAGALSSPGLQDPASREAVPGVSQSHTALTCLWPLLQTMEARKWPEPLPSGVLEKGAGLRKPRLRFLPLTWPRKAGPAPGVYRSVINTFAQGQTRRNCVRSSQVGERVMSEMSDTENRERRQGTCCLSQERKWAV